MKLAKLLSTFFLALCFLPNMAFPKPDNSVDFSVKDAMAFSRISQVNPSSDGKQVMFSVMRFISTKNQMKREYLLYLKREDLKPTLLFTGSAPFQATWSNDGKRIEYFKNSDTKTLWTYTIKSKYAKQRISFPVPILSYKWSPQGNEIAFVAKTIKKSPQSGLKPIDVAHNSTNLQLYIMKTTSHAQAKPLTSPKDSIAIYSDFDGGFDWSPDGGNIVYAYQPRSAYAYDTQRKIAILHIKSGKITPIPYADNHTVVQPFYSPDGKWIAFRSYLTLPHINSRKVGLANNVDPNSAKICVANTKTLATHCLTNTPNKAPMIVGWNKSGEHIIALDWYKTDGPTLYSLPLRDSKKVIRLSSGQGFIEPNTLSLNKDRTTFGFGYEFTHKAPQAFISPVKPFSPQQISHIKQPREKYLGTVKVIQWQSKDKKNIEGILMLPSEKNSQKPHPLLVVVHGGPASAWAKRYIGGCDEYGEVLFPSCWGPLLSQGFAIFQPNYRGSSGYGRPFRLANTGDFGGGDYQDIMSGIDALIKKGIAKPKHLAIFGWSYGGYMTAWAITRSHRFSAAVEGAGLINLISESGTSENLGYVTRYLGAAFWNNKNLYLNRSPIMFTDNIKTPLLIFHGENDSVVSITQSYELYNALNRQHKPVKFMLLPKQGHGPTNPNIIYQTIQRVNKWLKQAL